MSQPHVGRALLQANLLGVCAQCPALCCGSRLTHSLFFRSSLRHGARASPMWGEPCSRPTCYRSLRPASAQHVLCCGPRPTHISSLCHGARASPMWGEPCSRPTCDRSLRPVPSICCAVVPGRLTLAACAIEHWPAAHGRAMLQADLLEVCAKCLVCVVLWCQADYCLQSFL
jgi:hypothetical protein